LERLEHWVGRRPNAQMLKRLWCQTLDWGRVFHYNSLRYYLLCVNLQQTQTSQKWLRKEIENVTHNPASVIKSFKLACDSSDESPANFSGVLKTTLGSITRLRKLAEKA